MSSSLVSRLSLLSSGLVLASGLVACSGDPSDPYAGTTTGTTTGAVTGTTTGTTTGTGDATGTSTGSTVVVDGSLAAAYTDYFPIGVAIAQSHIDTVGTIITTHFNHLTAENAMKWGMLETAEGTYNWTEADSIAQLARDNGWMMTGHALVWHRQTPTWLFADTPDEDTLKARMKAHIDTMIPRYADVVDNWDVVNEAVSDDGSKDYRDGGEGSKFYSTFEDEEYVHWAFKCAYDAYETLEPGSSAGKLYYNDYNVNLKLDRIITLLDAIKNHPTDPVPVDGIGLQAHVRIDWPSISELEDTITTIIAAGYKVKISELDVTLYNDYPNGDLEAAPEVVFTPELEAEQAERYADLFELFRKYKDDITSVSVWGVSDDATWLDSEPVAGRDNFPLLFNDAHEPKLAVPAIMDF